MPHINIKVFGASHDAASVAAQSWAAAYRQGQENGTYARPRRQEDDLLRHRRRRLMSSSKSRRRLMSSSKRSSGSASSGSSSSSSGSVSGGSGSGSTTSTTSRNGRTKKRDNSVAWLPGAKLRAEVEVRAPGALGSGAAGGLRASVPPVVMQDDWDCSF